MLFVIVILALIHSKAHAGLYKPDDGVLELHYDNFKDTIMHNKYILVEFCLHYFFSILNISFCKFKMHKNSFYFSLRRTTMSILQTIETRIYQGCKAFC